MEKNKNYVTCFYIMVFICFIFFSFICFIFFSWNIFLINDNKELQQNYNDKLEFSNLGWNEFDKCQNNFNNLQVERNFYRLKFIECSNVIEKQQEEICPYECSSDRVCIPIFNNKKIDRWSCIEKNKKN